MLAGAVQVQVHLAGVGVRGLVELQVDDDEAAQPPVEEQEVDSVPGIADPQTLATDHREVAAQLEEKGLLLGDQRVFEVALRVLVLEELEEGRDPLSPPRASSRHRDPRQTRRRVSQSDATVAAARS